MRKRILAAIIALALAIAPVAGIGCPEAEASDYSNPAILPMGGTWTSDLWLTETNETETYKVTIPSDGNLNMRIMEYWPSGLGWRLYNADMSEKLYGYDYVEYGSPSSPTTEAYDLPLSAGTYYLEMKKYGDGGKYKMCNTFTSYHTNDGQAFSYDSPQDYTLGTAITGGLTLTDKEDWYRVSIPKGKNLILKITEYWYSGLNWSLHNADLSVEVKSGSVDYGTDSAPKTKTYDIAVSAGTYYLKFKKYGNGGKYLFTLSELSQGNCTHEYESSTVYPTYTARGYTVHKCKKCGKSYRDEYTAKRTLGQVSLSSYYNRYRKKLKISWYTVNDATGYQVKYATDKKMKKNAKTLKTKNTYKTIKKLKRRKKYYIKVRAYRREGSKTVYGKWSAKGKAKTL